jgi:hypothetical protein
LLVGDTVWLLFRTSATARIIALVRSIGCVCAFNAVLLGRFSGMRGWLVVFSISLMVGRGGSNDRVSGALSRLLIVE